VFDYYHLAHPQEGVGSGFQYEAAKHITSSTIANSEPAIEETLYDRPCVDNSKTRVTGPFTVEAVPAPTVRSLDEVGHDGQEDASLADASVGRFGATLRHSEWRTELLKTGLRGKGGQKIEFSRVE